MTTAALLAALAAEAHNKARRAAALGRCELAARHLKVQKSIEAAMQKREAAGREPAAGAGPGRKTYYGVTS